MSVEAARVWAAGPRQTAVRWLRQLGKLSRRFGLGYHFTSITRRIVVLNLAGLLVLVAGMLFLNTYRAGLIDSRRDNLLGQGQIISAAIADRLTLERERPPPGTDIPALPATAFRGDTGEDDGAGPHLDPEQLTPLIRTMARQTGIRVRVYDHEGAMIVDSLRLFGDTPASLSSKQKSKPPDTNIFTRAWRRIQRWTLSYQLPLHKDLGSANGKGYPEVRVALLGEPMQMVSVNERGETLVGAGVPIKRLRKVVGALMLTSREGEIDDLIAKERGTIVSMALLVVAVTGALSIFLAGTIANPMRRLAQTAEQVRVSIKSREPIPDFTHRSDEIGHLSRALRDMTFALYRRIDAIESFAADVAHELKNPLTSLRSAADTLPLVKSDSDRERLVHIIQHDVRRMNRLITDISDVSRLDAEMAREDAETVDVAKFMTAICGIINDIHREGTPPIRLKIISDTVPRKPKKKGAPETSDFLVNGHESRLSQVINNIVDNAVSFSPADGQITVTCRRLQQPKEIEITIEDDGPGIEPENLEKVFTRFYTDRPEHEEFGQNSGLGLHISQQIITGHGGRLWAENRTPPAEQAGSAGARFVIRLPAL